MTAAVDALLAPGGTPLRADAQRNVERLVAAARAALDEEGIDVTTRDIARRAGVGLGTLYRRIPSLTALLTAILIDTIDEIAAVILRVTRYVMALAPIAIFAALASSVLTSTSRRSSSASSRNTRASSTVPTPRPRRAAATAFQRISAAAGDRRSTTTNPAICSPSVATHAGWTASSARTSPGTSSVK